MDGDTNVIFLELKEEFVECLKNMKITENETKDAVADVLKRKIIAENDEQLEKRK